MTPDTWIALGGLALSFLVVIAGSMAFILRQIDQAKTSILTHASELYARRDHVAEIKGEFGRLDAKIDLVLGLLARHPRGRRSRPPRLD